MNKPNDRDGYKHSHREVIDAYNDLRSFIGSKLRAEFDRLRGKR